MRIHLLPAALAVVVTGLFSAPSATPQGAVAAPDLDPFLARATTADAIAVVTLVAKRSRWDAGHELIVSDCVLSVQQRLFGELAGSLELTILGGEVGEIGLSVSDSPSFEANRVYMVLLDSRSGRPEIAGGAEGIIQLDAEGARSMEIQRRVDEVLRARTTGGGR